MALTDDNGMVMPVTPYGGMFGGNNGNFGGDWGWIILLLLLAGNGWGNGFGGFGGGNELYPWMNQSEVTTNGFQNLSTQNQISSVQDGLNNISTQLCNGFAGVNATVSNGFAQAEIAENGRAMANMQQLFGLQSQFADCCCENRLASCQTQNIIQNEGNMTRFADANNTRDIMTAITSGIQSIKDDLCADRLEAERRENANLRQELMFSRGQASQIAQNSEIINGVYNRLNECPVGTVPVYGEQPIFSCPNNNGCGCGCGNF